MPGSPPKLLELLRALAAADVQFVVVGGVAAALMGAPVTTFDLDIVHRRDPENLGRLLGVLKAIGAHYRGRPGQQIEPEIQHLASPGHQLLISTLGPIDVLGAIDNGRDYEALRDHSVAIDLQGSRIEVLDLETL